MKWERKTNKIEGNAVIEPYEDEKDNNKREDKIQKNPFFLNEKRINREKKSQK